MECLPLPSIQKIERAAHKSWLDDVVRQLNTVVEEAAPPSTTKPPPKQQYNVEQAKIDEKAIVAAAGAAMAGATGTKRQKMTTSQELEAAAAAHVAEWMADFDKNGRKGYVGLVPRPLQSKYPAAATGSAGVMDTETVQCVEHFCAWFLTNNKK
jgi:hypothetical protein